MRLDELVLGIGHRLMRLLREVLREVGAHQRHSIVRQHRQHVQGGPEGTAERQRRGQGLLPGELLVEVQRQQDLVVHGLLPPQAVAAVAPGSRRRRCSSTTRPNTRKPGIHIHSLAQRSVGASTSRISWSKSKPRSWARPPTSTKSTRVRSEEHTSELQSRPHLVCRLLLEKKKK